MRTYDALKVAIAIKHFLKTEEKVDPIEWLSNPSNIVLENEQGDLALFEWSSPISKVYSGHYYFKSRGRDAIKAAKGFLDELFNSCYNIHVLIGLVPVERKEVKWLTRRVGFTSHGLEEIHGQQYELFIITRDEFNSRFEAAKLQDKERIQQ
jgi:hypothetical protein